MAEGCNLYTTDKDFKEIQNSLNKGLPSDQRRFASTMLRTAQKSNLTEFMNVLSNLNHPQHDLVNKTLIKAFGEGKVTKPMEEKLSRAVHTILKDHSNPQGLFEKPPTHRGPGSTSVDHPYEVLCAAALVQDKVKSSTGHLLKIYSTDRLDLGQKSPSNHILSTAKKGTIESDILIQRNGNVIGIDAKYTNKTTYRPKPGLTRQLKGIKSALQDYDITEYHFVTNAKFSSDFKKMVDNMNRELIADAMKNNEELYGGIRNIISTPEQKTINAVELATKLDFERDRGKINSLINNRVPQIGYCEEVNFK